MLFSHSAFIGLDPTAGRKPFTYAALDADGKLLALAAGELDEALAFVGGQQAVTVAVNAPPRPNLGLVRKKLEEQRLTPGYLRGADVRMAEYDLRQHGIVISTTPSRAELCPEWMQLGFELYRQLEKMGFKPFPAREDKYQMLETHPHAAFCVLIGQVPLPKPTLEGRLQRQLVLHERVSGIRDPMEFFEEITRFRLLKGTLPLEFVYAAEELDALIAAYVAYLAANKPGDVSLVGAEEEGRIVLPGEVKEKY